MTETLSTHLPADLKTAIDQAVEAGEYASSNEVIDEAVREWKERRENHGYTLAELRKLIQEGIDSGPEREFDVDQFLGEMHERHQLRKSA